MKLQITTLIMSLALITACGGKSPDATGGGNSGSGSTGPQSAQSTPDTGTGSTASQQLQQMNMTSAVDDSSNLLGFNGAVAVDLDKKNGVIILMMPMPSGFIFTPSGVFSKYPDITFGPVYDASGKMKIAVRIPVKYILKGLSLVPAATLPNGDPLPAMPTGQGQLPSLALNFPVNGNTQIVLYIGVDALGLFINLPSNLALPIPMNITLPLKNSDKSRFLGDLTYVNAKGSYPPGLFIATIIPNDFARILEDNFGL